MRKADRETESRKLIGEKLREARMADNSPMTEADAEYYRILAEARATHASKENTRKSAKKHAFTSAAAILLILAVAGGSFILGMQSDVRASADPDDERKVVQQGDNVVIGSGVSEDDENVGVVTKTYKSINAVPDNVKEEIQVIDLNSLHFVEMKVYSTMKTGFAADTEYKSGYNQKIVISQNYVDESNVDLVLMLNYNKGRSYKEYIIYEEELNNGHSYSFIVNDLLYNIFMSNSEKEIKIEDIIDALIY